MCRWKTHLALLLGICLSSLVFADDKPCTIHDNGLYYDLNPLKSNKDYELQTPGGHNLAINVCQNVKGETFGLKDGVDAASVGGYVRRDHGDFSIGKFTTTLSVFDSRPRFVLSDGSQCKARSDSSPGDARASTLVQFVCDMSVFGPGEPKLLTQLPPGDDEVACAFIIEWKSQFACPTTESGGAWGFFAILSVTFLVILISYTLLGTLYNRYVLQLRGFEQIPQFSLESMRYHANEVIDWLKDISAGSGASQHRRNGLNASGDGGSTNPVSHHTQTTLGDEELGREFIRPPQGRSLHPKMDINPVSHQSQVHAERRAQSLSMPQAVPHQVASPSPPQPPEKDHHTSQIGSQNTVPAREGKEFTLGDDDFTEEMADKSAGYSRQELPVNSTPSSDELITLGANIGPSSVAAASRGRDLGEGNVITL